MRPSLCDTDDELLYPETISIENLSKQNPSTSAIPAEQLAIIEALDIPSYSSIEASRKIAIGKRTHQITLVLDLDNTLVYTTESNEAVQTSGTSQPETAPSLAINVRPYALWFLETMSKFFEIVIFTVAERDYAEAVLEILDPGRQYVKALLCRENSCATKEGYFVKDLRVIEDREIDSIYIVDNSAISFAFQMQRGILVKDYFGEDDDEELLSLARELIALSEAPAQGL